jgi:hypothetical protein
MSERKNWTHNGRDGVGNFRVRRVDLEDVETDPNGVDYIRDDVRAGGAVADTGAAAGERAKEIERSIRENRENVKRLAHRDDAGPH